MQLWGLRGASLRWPAQGLAADRSLSRSSLSRCCLRCDTAFLSVQKSSKGPPGAVGRSQGPSYRRWVTGDEQLLVPGVLAATHVPALTLMGRENMGQQL